MVAPVHSEVAPKLQLPFPGCRTPDSASQTPHPGFRKPDIDKETIRLAAWGSPAEALRELARCRRANRGGETLQTAGVGGRLSPHAQPRRPRSSGNGPLSVDQLRIAVGSAARRGYREPPAAAWGPEAGVDQHWRRHRGTRLHGGSAACPLRHRQVPPQAARGSGRRVNR